ncbi:unnamed protein product [Cyprideis torosa]|uniref:Uncharacterized protein n=1 Tax=Cyprideis torosa TaxID=163714 RepID=A0A7R8X2G2_9CRUS|nr:unnamed protein product [Cyprideis torosa]CAG0911850.1 unnamed protein product [Cyprideis torosa]
MQPDILTKALSDPTRLRIVMLLTGQDELCVCELTQALELAQPKISRHLAILRESGLLQDRKAGLWVYYRLHTDLPAWVLQVLNGLQTGCVGKAPFEADHRRLLTAEKQDQSVSACR